MPTNRIVGIVLLVFGGLMVFFAYGTSGSFDMSRGRPMVESLNDRTTILLVIGVISAVAGVVSLLVPASRPGLGPSTP